MFTPLGLDVVRIYKVGGKNTKNYCSLPTANRTNEGCGGKKSTILTSSVSQNFGILRMMLETMTGRTYQATRIPMLVAMFLAR